MNQATVIKTAVSTKSTRLNEDSLMIIDTFTDYCMEDILKSKVALAAGIGIFILLYIAPLGVRPMAIPDEYRYAEISREMLDSGDWIVPRLDGLRYFEKPVLGYWLNAAAIYLFGENAFAVRLPSAISAGLSAALLFLLVSRFTKANSAGLLVAAIFLTYWEVFGVGVFCVLDSMLSLFITAAMVSFFLAYNERKSGKATVFLGLVGVSCGMAFLTKGFIGLAVLVLAIVPFLLWEHRWKDLARFPIIPVFTALLVALPWSLLVHFRQSDFWNYFFWNEHIRCFLSSQSAQHAEPFWFFVPMILAGALPWTALFAAVVSGLKRTSRKNPLFRFVLCHKASLTGQRRASSFCRKVSAARRPYTGLRRYQIRYRQTSFYN